MSFAAALTGPCFAESGPESSRTLTVGYYDFPPAIYTDAQGRPQGPVVSLARKVLEHAGYQPRFRGLPSARLYAALKDGTIDIWPGAPGKPELLADTLEGRETLAQISLNLYYRADTPPPQIPEGLAGRGVIVIGGYNYWPAVNKMLHAPQLNIRLHRASNHASALEMLQHRRADYLLDYQIPVDQALQRLGIPALPYETIHEMPIRFIVSRHVDDSRNIVDALDRSYAELAAAGEDMRLPE